MKKILVPCDFSETAVNAFRFAVEIAKKSKGEIILLKVIELQPLYDTVLMPALNFEETFLNDLKVDAESSFRKLKAKWAGGSVKVTAMVEFGIPSVIIRQVVVDKKADLVVMGTNGVSGLKESFAGSNAERTVRTSPVPVIVVKKHMKFSQIKNIVFPNTLEGSQEALTMKVKALQEFFKARIHIVFVNTPLNFRNDIESKVQLKGFAERFMFRNFTLNVYNDVDQESGIVNFAHEKGADMIAMATHGRRGINRLLSGSLAESVVNHVNYPIWTLVEK